MKGVSFLMMPIVTRFLDVADYGRLDVLVTMLNLGSILLGLGLVDAMYRFSGLAKSTSEKKRIASSTYSLCGLLALLLVGLVFPFSWVMVDWLPGNIQVTELNLALATLAISATINVPLAWLRMQDKAALFFLMTAGKSIVQALLCFVMLSFGGGVEAVLWAGLIANVLLALGLVFWQHHDTGLMIDLGIAPSLLWYGTPLIAGGLFMFMTNGAERWFLAAIESEAALAPYAIACQFALIATFLLEPFTLWWFPKRFSLLERPDGLALNARFAALGATLSLLAVVLLAGLSPLLITVLLPDSYHAAIPMVSWCTLAIAIKQCSHILNLGCYTGSSTGSAAVINGAVAVLAILLFPLMIYWKGAFGAVFASLIIYSFRLGLFFWASQRVICLQYPKRPLFIAATLAILVVTFGGMTASLPIILSVSFLSMIVILRECLELGFPGRRFAWNLLRI